jgi:hypothetical protein
MKKKAPGGKSSSATNHVPLVLRHQGHHPEGPAPKQHRRRHGPQPQQRGTEGEPAHGTRQLDAGRVVGDGFGEWQPAIHLLALLFAAHPDAREEAPPAGREGVERRAAVLTAGLPLEGRNGPSARGAAEGLIQGRLQVLRLPLQTDESSPGGGGDARRGHGVHHVLREADLFMVTAVGAVEGKRRVLPGHQRALTMGAGVDHHLTARLPLQEGLLPVALLQQQRFEPELRSPGAASRLQGDAVGPLTGPAPHLDGGEALDFRRRTAAGAAGHVGSHAGSMPSKLRGVGGTGGVSG